MADGKRQAIALCEEAGGDPSTTEIVELETIPEPYAMDGSFRLVVRAVSTIKDIAALGRNGTGADDNGFDRESSLTVQERSHDTDNNHPDRVEQYHQLYEDTYRPEIKEGVWSVSETDIEYLIAGTGVLGVGCIGEATNYLLSLKACLRAGQTIRIRSCRSVGAEEVICAPLFMVSGTIQFSPSFLSEMRGGGQSQYTSHSIISNQRTNENISQGSPSVFVERLPSGDE